MTKTTEGQREVSMMSGPRKLYFNKPQICALTGLSKHTMHSWVRDGWVVPAIKRNSGAGGGYLFTAWQAAGLAVLAGCMRSARFSNTYIGKSGVIRAMAGLAERDDALLLPPQHQDPWVQEEAAKIACAAIVTTDLPEEARENLRRVVAAIHAITAEQHERDLGQRIHD